MKSCAKRARLRIRGCGRSALYTCFNSTCAREYTDGELRTLATPTPVYVRPAGPGAYGTVQRSYDERQAMYFVRAKLGMGGVHELYLAGAPKQALTTVHVQMGVRGVQAAQLGSRNALRVRINDRPYLALNVKVENADKGGIVRVAGRFEFEIFKPLSQPYATMAVETCGRAVVTVPEHMPKLIEFFEIYSQIATEVQAESQRTPAAPASAQGAVPL